MAPKAIMLMRHAEKPDAAVGVLGVNHRGEHDDHSLSVVGWQRAGALAAFLANSPERLHSSLVAPERVFATKPSKKAKSRRELDTASPAASRLDVDLDTDHGHGQLDQLAAAILADPRPTLVVWHHGELPELARLLGVSADEVPERWPDDRYDLIWLLYANPAGDGYRLVQVPQGLLVGDRTT